jgi:pimeloyl-ACP methyl ester carboxylesterase
MTKLFRVLPLATVLLLTLAAGADAAPKGPRLSTPQSVVREATICDGKLAGTDRNPVLLIHGTFADSEINWRWNYQKVLPEMRGETACTLDLPEVASGDAQLSTEYVVRAIRFMAERSERRVAIISHSQGGLEARWALKWWPDLRRLVSDVVMFVPPNHGAVFTDRFCSDPGSCAAAMYQMRSDSNFLAVLNGGRHAFGRVAMTSIVTNDDAVFVLPEQGLLGGSSRQIADVALQDLCPGHQAQHNDLPFDGPGYAIATDALDHPGPADLSRIDAGAACADDTMPGVDRAYATSRLAGYSATLAGYLGPNGPKAEGEPPLAPYVN